MIWKMIKKAIADFCSLEVHIHRKPFFVNSLLVMLSISLTFVVIEVCYRTYKRFNPPLTVEAKIGHRFLPNASGIYIGGKTSTDKYGFRNGIDITAWEKERKVMLIGDSVGFGQGIDDDQTISHNLNEAFEKSNIGFLNLCNPSWDTVLLRGRLYKHGVELGPWDLILWMYYINDAKYSIKYFPLNSLHLNKEKPTGKYRILDLIVFKWPHAVKKRVKKYTLSKK
jgi:hypothetical protein